MIFPFPIGNFLQWLTGRVRVNMNHEERRYRTRYQISDIRYQISDSKYQISNIKYQISQKISGQNKGYKMSESA